MADNKIHEVIIIGSGPAGYTAGLYTARASLAPLIFSGKEPGGQLTTTTVVENYPGFPDGVDGPELMDKMKAQAEKFGATVQMEEVTKVDFTSNPKKVYVGETEYQAKAVVISTGARSRTLGLPREKDFWAKGVHTCATCDGFFYKDKEVAMIGGGDSAMEEASFMTKFASKVYIIYRKDKFKASKVMQDRVLANKKIEVIWNTEVVEYLGEDKLSGVKIKNNKTNEIKELVVSAIFFAIGHIPNTEIFKGIIDLDDKMGYINVKDSVYTNIEGVFAGGDCVDYIYRQAVTSAGLGCMAGMAAERWLQKQG